MGSEQGLFGYGLLGGDTTPYVPGSTPPYDLEDLSSRHPTETLSTINPNTSNESGIIDFADDLSDFFDFNAEVEKISGVPGNVPAPSKVFRFIDSGEEKVSEASKAATPPAEAANPAQAGGELSPPTPHWPGLSPSVDREPTPAAPNSPNLPDRHDITTELPFVAQAPFHEEPQAFDLTSRPNVFPSMNDTATVLTQDQNKSFDAISLSSRPEHSPKTQITAQQPSLNSPPPVPSSPIGARGQRDLSKWINIAPSPAHLGKSSSPIIGSSGFVDNGVTASFHAPIRSSPSLRQLQDTSPTGLTQMRQSRLRAKEAEEDQARIGRFDSTTNLEEGAQIKGRFKYPEHPSFHSRGDYENLASNHRVASAFKGTSQSTYPQHSSSTTYNRPSNFNNLNEGVALPTYRSPYPSYTKQNRATSIQPTYSSQNHSGHLEYPSISRNRSGQLEYPNVSQNRSGHLDYPSISRNRSGHLDYPSVSQNRSGPLDYPSVSQPVHQLFNTGFNPRNIEVRNPAMSQNAAPPRLIHQSSSGDSLRVFPPTPVGTATPQAVPSPKYSAYPSPNYLAGQHALATTVQHPAAAPSHGNTSTMPHYPRLSPSTSALELKLPNQVAGTSTPASETGTPAPDISFLKRRPGRPRKDPNEPVTKRVPKPQAKTPTDATAGAKEAAVGAEEGAVRQKRPYKKRAKATEDGGPAGEEEKGTGAGAEGDEAAAAKPPKKSRTRVVEQESEEAKQERLREMLTQETWGV